MKSSKSDRHGRKSALGGQKSGDLGGFSSGNSQLLGGSWVKKSDETQQIPRKGLV